MVSHRAALVAVLVALITGVVFSLALRPPGATPKPTMGEKPASQQSIHWRVPLAVPQTLPVSGEIPVYVADRLAASSNEAFRLDLYDPGELVGAFGVTGAVRERKVEAGFTWLGYDQGEIPASALLAATPFGFEPWEYIAWWIEGGGKKLAEDLYRPYNIVPLFCGIIGPETAGWFRQPIESLDDIKGLKVRFGGLGGKVLERAGASVTTLPGGEIYQALEKGAIDAAEFSLPVIDQLLGFSRVAKNNYFPGWHQPYTAMHFIVNQQTWDTLSDANRVHLETVCMAAITRSIAASEARQGAVIRDFPKTGVKARRLPMEILRELQVLTDQVLNEEAEKNPQFEAILKSQRDFSKEYAYWKRLAYLPRDF
jgi:TRAP-type mannitol/chloroaromatic compound transport system substrate-binding protein